MQWKNKTFDLSTNSVAVAVQTSLCLVLIVTGVLGNGIICFLLIRFKGLRTIPNILLTNLATVDLLNIIINVPFIISSHVCDLKTLYSKTAAWWTTFLFILFVQLNLSSMLLLVFDRYLALAHSFKYKLWRTPRKIFCAICLIWLWPFLITGSITLPLRNIELGAKSIFYYRIIYLTRNNAKYYIIPQVLTLLIPIIVLSVFTMREVCKKASVKTIENGVQILRKNRRRKTLANVRSAATILTVLLVYALCVICGALLPTIAIISDENLQWFFFLGMYTMLCGSTFNSCIYAIRSSKFRNALRQTFKHSKCSRNRIHHQQKKGAVIFVNGHFGKQHIYLDNSLFDKTQSTT